MSDTATLERAGADAIPAAGSAIRIADARLRLGSEASAVQVLDGLSIEVPRGISLGVVGPSGSGKTTLLMVVTGLERVDTGTVEVLDADLGAMSEDEVAAFRGRSVGIVFQSFHLIPNMTALENVAVPLELAGAADAFERAEAELRAVGLGERIGHYPGQLSGGEQQRVAIARALAPRPPLVVADEPTGNLDGQTGEQVAQLLFEQTRRRGTTLVLVTHDPELAARCDRQVSVRAGRIAEPLAEAAE